MIEVKVSAASARQRFHGCEPAYIRDVCRGACCRSSTAPTGILVVIHRSEADAAAAIRDFGGDVEPTGYVRARPGERRCPAQTPDELCALHGTAGKPFGCVASPFTLNRSGTLIIRNRYRMLRCFGADRKVALGDPVDEPALPAYVAFRGSLDRIFGEAEAERICAHLDAGGGDLVAAMPETSHRLLVDNDHARHTSAPTGGEPVTETMVDPEGQEPTSGPPRWIEYRRPEDVEGAPINPKEHDRAGIRASIRRLGFTEAPFLDERTGRLIAGHGRIDELIAMEAEGEDVPGGIVVDPDGRWTLPIQRGWASADDDEAEIALLASNLLPEAGGWDEVQRAEMLRRIAARDEELLRSVGFDRAGLDRLLAGLSDPVGTSGVEAPSLRDRFLVPPFDVLDARQGWWRERKQAWLALGIRSEIGRSAGKPNFGGKDSAGDAWIRSNGEAGPTAVNRKRGSTSRPDALLLKSDSGRDSDYYRKKQAVEARLGRSLTTEEFQRDYYVAEDDSSSIASSGTSVFDPVLCELVYRWYSREGDRVLDPFAGGSVRGIVAAILGRAYDGFDLSTEQVKANQEQVDGIVPGGAVTYDVGDARQLLADLDPERYALSLTCPPYLSMERYSDDPADLCNMSVADFRQAVLDVLRLTHRALLPDAFAVWVVGQVRLPDGRGQVDLRSVVGDAATRAGFTLHNAGVLITPIGSLAVRAPRQFQGGRMLGRTYQDVIVLAKGSAKAAAERLGEIDVADPVELGLDDA